MDDNHFQSVLTQLTSNINLNDPLSTLDYVTKILNKNVPNYNWVGIYLLNNDKLLLKSYSGPQATEHTVIDVGAGICGLAARTAETVIVPDVNKDPRYLACFLGTKSEIVVPILHNGSVCGEIDIDSDILDAFTEHDQNFLESVANLISPVAIKLV